MRALFFGAAALAALAACGGAPSEPKAVREPTPEEHAQAEAFLEANATPLPEAWEFSRLTFGDGLYVRVGHAPRADAKGTIIFVPGYTSSPELASDFLAEWDARGYEVASVDMPGQGESIRREDDYQKTYTGDFSVYGQAVAAAVANLEAERLSEGPLIVAGDSFGAHSVLRGAADTGLPEADGLFVLVPAVMPVLEAPKFLVKWVIGRAVNNGQGDAYMDGMGPWSADDFAAYDVTRCGDREDRNFKNAALYITKPELRVGGPTNAWGLGMVTSGEDLLKSEALRTFDRPVQMVIAGQDVIVQNKYAERLCTKRMGSCDVTHIDEATHCVYLEDDGVQAQVHDALELLVQKLQPAL
ncbi:MAG: alpha/beta hydrolase [Pseudomonadota bacterium]